MAGFKFAACVAIVLAFGLSLQTGTASGMQLADITDTLDLNLTVNGTAEVEQAVSVLKALGKFNVFLELADKNGLTEQIALYLSLGGNLTLLVPVDDAWNITNGLPGNATYELQANPLVLFGIIYFHAIPEFVSFAEFGKAETWTKWVTIQGTRIFKYPSNSFSDVRLACGGQVPQKSTILRANAFVSHNLIIQVIDQLLIPQNLWGPGYQTSL